MKSDPCLFTKKNGPHQTIIAITINDFLVCASSTKLIDELYHTLSKKYSVKRLGKPTKYLNWKIKYN